MVTSWKIKKPFAVLDAAIWQYLKNPDNTSFQFKRYPEVEEAYVYYMAHSAYGKIELRRIGDNLSELSRIVPSNRRKIPKRYSAVLAELSRRLSEDELFTARSIASTRITTSITGGLPSSQEQNRLLSHTVEFNSGAALTSKDDLLSEATDAVGGAAERGLQLARGRVKGNATDIETWVRLSWEARLHAPVERRNISENGKVFRLIVYGHFLYRDGNFKYPWAQIEIAEWSDGTTDIRMWPEQVDAAFSDKEGEWKKRYESLAHMSEELLKKFPYVAQDSAASDAAPSDGKESGKGKPPLSDISALKNHFPKGTMTTAQRILEAIPEAYDDCVKSGGRWGPGEISKLVHVGSVTVGRYLRAFRKMGIKDVEGTPLPE